MPRNAWMSLPEGPARRFFASLNDLWWSRGAPSGRRISTELESHEVYVSQGTVQNLLNGPRLPRWETADAVVRHLAGDPELFLSLWRAAAQSPASAPTMAPPSARAAGPINQFQLVRELAALRRTGLSGRAALEHHSELELAVQAFLPQHERERLTTAAALRELLGTAAEQLDPVEQRAARVTFGLDQQSAGWSAADRRRAAAALYAVSIERFRKSHELSIFSNLAEVISVLYTRSQGNDAGMPEQS